MADRYRWTADIHLRGRGGSNGSVAASFQKGRRRCPYQWRGRGCKVGVNLHREQDEYTTANFYGNRTLFVIWAWGKAVLDQLVDVAGYGIGMLLAEGAKGNPGGLG